MISKTVATICLGCLMVAGVSSALAFSGEQYAGDAKINIQQARAIALKAYPGKIIDEELEHENGGSGLRYSFDIRKGHVTQEVGVDAKTGKVLENDAEGPKKALIDSSKVVSHRFMRASLNG